MAEVITSETRQIANQGLQQVRASRTAIDRSRSQVKSYRTRDIADLNKKREAIKRLDQAAEDLRIQEEELSKVASLPTIEEFRSQEAAKVRQASKLLNKVQQGKIPIASLPRELRDIAVELREGASADSIVARAESQLNRSLNLEERQKLIQDVGALQRGSTLQEISSSQSLPSNLRTVDQLSLQDSSSSFFQQEQFTRIPAQGIRKPETFQPAIIPGEKISPQTQVFNFLGRQKDVVGETFVRLGNLPGEIERDVSRTLPEFKITGPQFGSALQPVTLASGDLFGQPMSTVKPRTVITKEDVARAAGTSLFFVPVLGESIAATKGVAQIKYGSPGTGLANIGLAGGSLFLRAIPRSADEVADFKVSQKSVSNQLDQQILTQDISRALNKPIDLSRTTSVNTGKIKVTLESGKKRDYNFRVVEENLESGVLDSQGVRAIKGLVTDNQGNVISTIEATGGSLTKGQITDIITNAVITKEGGKKYLQSTAERLTSTQSQFEDFIPDSQLAIQSTITPGESNIFFGFVKPKIREVSRESLSVSGGAKRISSREGDEIFFPENIRFDRQVFEEIFTGTGTRVRSTGQGREIRSPSFIAKVDDSIIDIKSGRTEEGVIFSEKVIDIIEDVKPSRESISVRQFGKNVDKLNQERNKLANKGIINKLSRKQEQRLLTLNKKLDNLYSSPVSSQGTLGQLLGSAVPTGKVSRIELIKVSKPLSSMRSRDGAFAGTGQYERTEAVAALMPLSRSTQASPSASVFNLKLNVSQAQSSLTAQKESLALKEMFNQAFGLRQGESFRNRDAQSNLFRSLLAQRQNQRLRQNLKDVPSPTKNKLGERVATRGRGIAIPLGDTSRLKSALKKASKARAYDVFLKKKGKYVKIADDLPIGKALKLGADKTLNTIAASFKIVPDKKAKPIGKDIKYVPDLNKFRQFRISRGKQLPLPLGEFIEKEKYRLDSPGEKMDILRAKRSKKRSFF